MIYVDTPFDGWCHMVSDNIEELHTFALNLGLERYRFQNKPYQPHYDLRPRLRKKAVENGAKEVQRRELFLILKNNYG